VTWVAALAVLTLGLLAYGWFEAGWLRYRVVEIEIDGIGILSNSIVRAAG